jgi:membrane fusion protein, multidrug efflux system
MTPKFMNETSPKFKLPKINFRGPVTLVVEGLLALFLVWGIIQGVGIYRMVTTPKALPVVATDLVKMERWPLSVTAVTQLKSLYGTVIKAEASGAVKEISAAPGAFVKKGDLLMVIDADAERATAKLAKLTYDRAVALREQGVNSQSDLDTAEANYNAAQAALDKKEIRAPFDGKVGLNNVFVGQYVTPGTALISVESLNTIVADFALPQKDAGMAAQAVKVALVVDAYPDQTFEGKVDGVDPRVDEDTLTITVRGIFDNPDEKLLNGMNGVATMYLKDDRNVMVLPASAIVYSAYGDYVYVVENARDAKTKKVNQVVGQKFVKTGETHGDFIAILSGVEVGQEVVTAGQIKLRNGLSVKVDNSQKPAASENPTPSES